VLLRLNEFLEEDYPMGSTYEGFHRRSIQAIAEGRDPGDLATLDDQTGIEQIKAAVAQK
jgi:hypothetical protein